MMSYGFGGVPLLTSHMGGIPVFYGQRGPMAIEEADEADKTECLWRPSIDD
jgi:hypothetical protein